MHSRIKFFALLFLCLLPLSAGAVTLANCDHAPYEVTVNNGGMKRTVTLTRFGGEIQEFGPLVTFQLKGKPEFTVHEIDAEYCIWSGKITLQRLNTFGQHSKAGI